MGFAFAIVNNTDMVPDIQDIRLTNCKWLLEPIKDGAPISAQGKIGGLIEPTEDSDYELRLRVHYYYIAPGPGGADVEVKLGYSTLLKRREPFVGSTTTGRIACEYELEKEDGDAIASFTITRSQGNQ